VRPGEHRWTDTEKAEVLRMRAAGLCWPEIHKRLGLPVSLRALRTAGYRWGVGETAAVQPAQPQNGGWRGE
jgi:hypothetical protein